MSKRDVSQMGTLDTGEGTMDARTSKLSKQASQNLTKKLSLKKIDLADDQLILSIVALANEGLMKQTKQSEIAKSLKDLCDSKMANVNWNCCVGRRFGSHISHEKGAFMYFHIGQMAFLIFAAKK